MKKNVFGRHFKRDINERKALFKGLFNELVMHEQITTTVQKAKAIRGQVEKLITKAKRRKEEARQFIQPYLSAEAADKIITQLAPRFADRQGGYTRIIKLGERFSDNAAMAMIEWVDKPVITDIISPEESFQETSKPIAAKISKTKKETKEKTK
jgi:large subunit ribosomal protein L17